MILLLDAGYLIFSLYHIFTYYFIYLFMSLGFKETGRGYCERDVDLSLSLQKIREHNKLRITLRACYLNHNKDIIIYKSKQ